MKHFSALIGVIILITMLLIQPVHAAKSILHREMRDQDSLSALFKEDIVRAPSLATNGLRRFRPVPRIQVSTPSYPVGMDKKETTLVRYGFREGANVPGRIVSRAFQFFTQFGVPLSGLNGPYPTNIRIKPGQTTDWKDPVYLPESVMNTARSMNEYAVVLKTTFEGVAATGATFRTQSSLLILFPPNAFSKATPLDKAVDQPTSPSLHWESSIGAIDYEYCFDTIDNNSCDTGWIGTYWVGTYDTNAALKNLPPGTTFYWQVRSNNMAGTVYANKGSWWSFTTASDISHITVMNTNDSGPGSLRQAIVDIALGGTIDFDSSLSGQTINLTSTLTINKSLTIDGSALASKISLSGNNTVGVIDARSSVDIILNNLLITKGNWLWGGGISNIGKLKLVNCILSGNISNNNGGGIYNGGQLEVINSAILNNSALAGGGIYNDDYVGRVSDQGGILIVTNSTLSGNTADYGGGVSTVAGIVKITNGILLNNSASRYGAGIANGSTLTVLDSAFSDNDSEGDGGGIYNGTERTMTVTNSTFAGNSAKGWGGGIYNSASGVLNVSNGTFVRNSASSGGGIFNFKDAFYTTMLTIKNSTFSENSASTGGGILNMGTLNMTNSILANSVMGSDCFHNDFNGGIIGTNVNNLIEDNAAAPNNCGTPFLSSDPKLSPLADNGGFTQTMALLPGSPAIDAGDDASCTGTDQRGVVRPKGSHCDIGAYETEFPAKATLLSPNGNVGTSTPVYTWDEVSGATWYYLWINSSSGPVFKQWYTAAQANCNGTTCSIAPAGLKLSPGKYNWFIQTWNDAGYGPWSDRMDFAPTPPGKATLISPSGNVGMSTPVYTWNEVPEATWYYLWVNNSSGPIFKKWYTAAQANCNGTTCSVTPNGLTLVSGNYNWFIQTWNDAGYGPWSDRLDFAPMPGKVTLISPSGNIGTNAPVYTWTEVSGATWYYLWINNSSGLVFKQWYTAAQANCNGTTCSVTPAGLNLTSGNYNWWIQTWNDAGYGPWSSRMDFHTP